MLMLLAGCGPSEPATSEQLIRQDAQARQQWLAMHDDLQQASAEIAYQRDQLEDDRRRWAARERLDPILGAAITAAAQLVICSLPMVVLALLLGSRSRGPDHGQVDDAIREYLLDQLAANTRASRLEEDSGPNGHLES